MYFESCATVNDTKRLYHKLAMRWHPDRGGDNETMKAVNLEYEAALQRHHGETSMGSDGREHTYYYRADVERAAMDIIADLLAQRWADVYIDLVGTWVWVRGDTKPHRAALKDMGLYWHSKRVMWYWRPAGRKHRHMSDHSYASLCTIYGARSFETESETALAKA